MIIKKTDSEIFISHLAEAAVLKTLGFELLRLDMGHKPGNRIFVFAVAFPAQLHGEYGDVSEIIRLFNNDKLELPAHSYFDVIHDLKYAIYDSQRTQPKL